MAFEGEKLRMVSIQTQKVTVVIFHKLLLTIEDIQTQKVHSCHLSQVIIETFQKFKKV